MIDSAGGPGDTILAQPAAVRRALERLGRDRPVLHPADGGATWVMDQAALRLLAQHLTTGMRTLEVGCGASTVVFAAAGAVHTAISPDPEEHARILAYCRSIDVSTDRVTFLTGLSDAVLPSLSPEPLDVALVDGAHSFPLPAVDWHYAAGRLRLGGVMVLDDLPVPAVALIARHMAADPGCRVLGLCEGRAGAFLKLADPAPGDDWQAQPFNRGYPDYSLLGRREAALRRARHHAYRLRRRLAGAAPRMGRS